MRTVALAACLALGVAGSACGEEPARGEFAYGAPLATDATGSLYAAPLPVHLYQHTAFADLRDVRVMNGRGEAVPYALRQPAVAHATVSSRVLPLFPLHGNPAAAVDALRLKVTAVGASVEINNPAPAATGQPPNGYLLDAQRLTLAAVALELAWDRTESDFTARLRVEASDDLQVWRSVVTDAPVVSLHYAGQQFLRARVELPPTLAKFLRLSWLGTGPTLTAVLAELRSAQDDEPRAHTRSAATPGKAGEYLYDLGGHFPVDRLSLALADDNSLAHVEYDARDAPGADWLRQASASVYRLKVADAPDLTDAPLPVATCRCRYWRVRVLSPAGGLGQRPPALVAGWSQDRVEFLARGAPPFELVYGDSEVAGATAAAGGLLAPVSAGGTTAPALIARAATVGAPHEIGGPTRLDRSRSTEFRRVAALWATLLVAVGLLGRMAWRLLRPGARAPGG